jgi:hypothetical protein
MSIKSDSQSGQRKVVWAGTELYTQKGFVYVVDEIGTLEIIHCPDCGYRGTHSGGCKLAALAK